MMLSPLDFRIDPDYLHAYFQARPDSLDTRRSATGLLLPTRLQPWPGSASTGTGLLSIPSVTCDCGCEALRDVPTPRMPRLVRIEDMERAAAAARAGGQDLSVLSLSDELTSVDFARTRIDRWEREHVVSWLRSVCRKRHIPVDRVTAFLSLRGAQLLLLSEKDFLSREPSFGSSLYRDIMALLIQQRQMKVEEGRLESRDSIAGSISSIFPDTSISLLPFINVDIQDEAARLRRLLSPGSFKLETPSLDSLSPKPPKRPRLPTP